MFVLTPSLLSKSYLATDHDVSVLARGVNIALRTTKTNALKPLLVSDLTAQSDKSLIKLDNDTPLRSEDLKNLVRERAETLYHPTSTCRMAPLEKGGVVDNHLKVRAPAWHL